MPRTTHFEGEITVSSRIVDYLSSGLYESPAACLKELVNNSYDADATLVEIFVKPDADRIIIADDGQGMNRAEFQRHFARISESHKRDEGDVTQRDRKKIGKIGIGFIAANEICDEMEVISTKEGSTELLRVTIHFDKMRQDIGTRLREDNNIAKADYIGSVDLVDAPSHFTHVFLKRVRGEARAILAGARSPHSRQKMRSLYGLNVESVRRILADQILSWTEFDDYSRTLLRVGLNVPVAYHEEWLPKRESHRVSDFARAVAALDFSVRYDGSELRKPIVLTPRDELGSEDCFVSRFNFNGKNSAAYGYFYAQHGTIKPEELQGLLIRIRHAAVGEYDASFLDFPATEGSLIQRWISAEIWADDRLEDAMNIDRRTLRVAHPAYVELQRAVHAKLREVIKQARKQIYGTRNLERRKSRAAEAVSSLREIVRRDVAPADAAAAASIDTVLRVAELRPEISPLSRRLTVPQFYSIVVEVARESLTPRAFAKFMTLLTERLNK